MRAEARAERQPWWERQRVQDSHFSPRRLGGRLFQGVCIAPQAAAPSVLLCFATVCVCVWRQFACALFCLVLSCARVLACCQVNDTCQHC
jgi:hypothetical protein